MQEALEAARKIAEDRGRSAASWVFDGNTEDSYYEWVLKGIDDGDPEIYNSLPESSFRDYSARELCDEIDVDYDLASSHEVDIIADEYLEEARTTFWHEVERLAREHLGSDES